MNVTLLTYDFPHRKTQDVAFRLLAAKIPFVVVAVPWVERKPRRMIYAHRPHELTWPCEAIGDPVPFFENLGIPYHVAMPGTLQNALDNSAPDVVVIGGAGILPKEVVERHHVLNIHPGLLPACRGLDTLKWAVHRGQRVGVTAHLCDEFTDLGWKLVEVEVPVFRNDTFHAFAMRQYEAELGTLVPALHVAEKALRNLNPRDRNFERVAQGDTEPTARMPRSIEAGLLDDFERFKLIYAR